MKNRFLLLLTLCTLSLTAVAGDKYNILLFTADDLHAEALKTFGGKLDVTPNLDKFATTGMVFGHACVNAAICSPSRKIIATGLYGHNSGAMGFKLARSGTPTLIDTFKKNGYLTGVIDKVKHSTPCKETQWDFVKGENKDETAYGRSPSLFYQHATAFFQRCKHENKPFYFMVNSRDPHRPYCQPGKLGHAKAEKPSRFFKPDEVEVPGFLPDIPAVRTEMAAFLNSTRRLDDTFGKVMQALDESGFAGKTLVIFMSDNGIAMPFAKANVWYHSNRTPLMARLPGVIKPRVRDDKHLISEVDFFPTFMELSGLQGPKKLDGRSFLPLLRGEEQDGRDTVYTQIDSLASGTPYPMRAIQDKRFLYIFNPFSDGKAWYRNANEGSIMKAMTSMTDNPEVQARVDLFRHRVPEELYDLEKDPNCLHNLVANPEYQTELKRLKSGLERYMKTYTDPMLAAFHNPTDRAAVDKVILDTYGKIAKPKSAGKHKTKKHAKKKR